MYLSFGNFSCFRPKAIFCLLTANPEDKIPSGSIFIANYSNLRLESGFQAGKEHDVLLKVYGPRKIELAVDGKGLGWISGGDITVGEEEEDTN